MLCELGKSSPHCKSLHVSQIASMCAPFSLMSLPEEHACVLGMCPTLRMCCTGLCFLLAFFSWGGLCVTQLGTVAGRASSLALWGFVTGLAAVLLVVQVLFLLCCWDLAFWDEPHTGCADVLLQAPPTCSKCWQGMCSYAKRCF